MKIVLHVGMPKTGSTALQSGLYTLRDRLSEGGILYPVGGRIEQNHQFLIHGSVGAKRLPRHLRHKYGGKEKAIGRHLESWLDSLREEIRARRPHTLILSAEDLFKIASEAGFIRLNKRLRSLSDDSTTIEVVAYLRRPSDYYLSLMQQALKAAHVLSEPRAIRYRPALEGYGELVADRMHVTKYDRSEWPDGEILRHFLDAFVPGAPAVEVPSREVNSSLSMEAMGVLQDYRKAFHSEKNNRFTPDTRRLTSALRECDPLVEGRRKSSLLEHIRRAIDQGSTDILWLRDEHGVVFDEVDYDEVRQPTDGFPSVEKVDDICPVDHERKALLTLRLLRYLASVTATTPN